MGVSFGQGGTVSFFRDNSGEFDFRRPGKMFMDEHAKFIAHKNDKLGSAGQLPAVCASLFKMNHSRYLRTALCAAILVGLDGFASSSKAGNAPVSARQAVDIAQEQLDLRGLQSSIQIESVVLQAATVLGSTRVWTVLWSRSVSADSGKLEVGVEVDMNGRVVRLVKKTAGGAKGSP